jgi:hypothetical protein
MKKGILVFYCIPFIFMWSCSRYVFSPPSPKKGTYANVKITDSDIISIDPNDTVAVRKYSLIENFTIIEIKERKGYYEIVVQSDSIRTSFNPITGKYGNHSFYVQYQIVSLKPQKGKGCGEIKEGQQYKLTLIPCIIYNPDVIPSIRYVRVYTKGMCFYVYMTTLDIYTTPDLDGLYYMGKVPFVAK